MPHRLKFRDRAELTAAYEKLLDQSWLESCCVDVPQLSLLLHVAEDANRARASAWVRRERRRAGGSRS